MESSMRTTLAFVSGLLLATPAFAHHGWSGYDETKPVTLNGTIQQVTAANPHATIKLGAQDKVWTVVLAPLSRMDSRGLPANRLKVGDTATVVAYVSKSDPTEARAERITADGITIELR
jgi:hypothetical protein